MGKSEEAPLISTEDGLLIDDLDICPGQKGLDSVKQHGIIVGSVRLFSTGDDS